MRTQRAGQSALLFLDVVELLNREHVDYIIIGAFALSVHGMVRASVDVDALLQLPYGRLKELYALFEAEHFGVVLNRGDDDDPIPSMLLLSDTYGNRVEPPRRPATPRRAGLHPCHRSSLSWSHAARCRPGRFRRHEMFRRLTAGPG